MASYWRPLYTLSGASIRTMGFAIKAATAFVPGDIVALEDGTVKIASAANTEVLGIAMDTVVAGAATGVQTNRAIVHPFNYDTVYAVKDADGTHTAAVAHIGDAFELEVSSGTWGVADAGTAGTAATPQFECVDIDTVRNEWHVVIRPQANVADFEFHQVDTDA